MTDDFIPTLSHATERDVDLLLVEELHSSLDFALWMASQVDVSSRIGSWGVKHSKRRTQSRREIDIFVEILHEDKSRSAILIENKLDTSEQPDQAESYREELDALANDYDRSAMIIVCPKDYAVKHVSFTGKFDAVVTYEAIEGFFREMANEASSETVLRYQFRADLIDQAINKHRRGYTPIPEKIVGDFNAQYVSLLRSVAPEIIPGPSMLKPANPRESTSMIFDQTKTLAGLPADIRPRRFAHELGRGSERRANYVAVTFGGWGKILPILANEGVDGFGAVFTASRATKTRPNSGLKIALPTAPVDNRADFDEQLSIIEEGMREALRLREWLLSNQATLRRWKALVEEVGSR